MNRVTKHCDKLQSMSDSLAVVTVEASRECERTALPKKQACQSAKRTSGMLLFLESGCGWVKQARIKIVVVNPWLRLICLSRSQRVDHANGFHTCLHVVDADDVRAFHDGDGYGGH